MSKNKINLPKSLKWYRKLATAKGRNEAGAFLVEGARAVDQIISSHPEEIIEIITIEKIPSAYHNCPTRHVTDNQFRSICFTKTPQEVIAIVQMPLNTYSCYLPENIGTKILLLEGIQDPGNVGTLIRTAAAFNFSGVILTDKCADHLAPKCVQSTAGTVLSVWIRRTDHYFKIIQALKKNGYPLIAADINGLENPSIICNRDKFLLALGNEASGLSKSLLDISDHQLKIPVSSEKAESLNVAACGAICMFLSSQKF